MKKLITITVLLALAMSGMAQQFSFSAVCESGQTLYYRITDAEAHTVILTHPYPQEGNPSFQGNYYEGYVKPAGEIIIPTVVTYNGTDYTVTAIDSNTFFECTGLTGMLDIPDGIVSIGEYAFLECGFSSISIHSSVCSIVLGAFANCRSIESITVDEENPTYYSENNAVIRREDKALVVGCKTTTIPDDIEIIGSYAFGGTGDGGDLVVPNSIRTIEEYAFMGCGFSGSIILSEALETIGKYAFSGGYFSGSLTIPNSVTEMGHNAFSYCQYLTGTLTLSSSLSTIDGSAFYNTHFTGTLSIPNSVKSIGGRAFCLNNFSELVLGDSLVTIVDAAFENCNNLTGTLRLPSSVTQIGSWAFCHTSFNEIYSPNKIPPTLGFNVFYEYDPNIPIHIPFGCTEAYQNAEGWNYFTNFIEEIPIIYTEFDPPLYFEVNDNAGHSAKILIDIDQDGLTDYKLSVGFDKHEFFILQEGLNSTKFRTVGFGGGSDTIPFSNGSETGWSNWEALHSWDGTGDFYDRIGIRKIIDGNKYYGWIHQYGHEEESVYPFRKWVAIDKVAFCTIPDYPLRWGQTSLDDPTNPFAVGDLLYEIISTDPSCVSVAGHVDGQAAQGELVIPETVYYQGINYTVTEIGDQAFAYCTHLIGSLVIPNSVTHIARLAFASCLFDSLFIPSSVTSISVTDSCGSGAFLGCSHLQSIIVDEANSVYDSRDNCKALIETATNTLLLGCKNTIIPNTVNSIGNCAFAGCTELDVITIPNSVERLERSAFYECNSLITITLPSSVTYIGDYALGCYGLTSITCKSSIPPTAYYEPGPEIYYHSFWGVNSEIPIHIPFGCTEAYQNAEGWNYFTNFIEEIPIIYTEFEGDSCQFFKDVPEEGFCLDLDGDSVCDFVTIGGVYNVVSPMTIGFRALNSEWELTNCFRCIDVLDTLTGPGWPLPVLEQYNDTRLDTVSRWYNKYWWGPYVFFIHPIVDTTINHLMYGFRHEIPSTDAEKHYCYGWLECSNRWNYSSPGKDIQHDQFTQAWLCVNRMAYCTIPDYPLHVGQTSLEEIEEMKCAEWYYEIQNLDGSITYQHLECVGDTLFDREGKRPKIIIRSNTQYDKDLNTEMTHEYVYEENGKVYWWNKDLEEFTVLYDLAANVGDEWEIKVGTESLTMHVDAVEYTEYEGHTYRTLRVSDENDLFSGDIVCGIGHLTSFFPERLMTRDKCYHVDGMRCYWVDGELAFKLGDDDCDKIYLNLHSGIEEDDPSTGSGAFMVYPNPANDVLFVETHGCASIPAGTEYRITNLMGQTVLSGLINAEKQQIDISRLPAGMYFINVGDGTRKFVVK